MANSISLFGELRLTCDERAVAVRSLPAAKLLALLAVGPEEGRRRTALAESLWPGIAFKISGNRLRTTLVELRRELAGTSIILSATRTHVALHSVLESDLSVARRLERRLKSLADDLERIEVIDQILGLTAKPFLIPWSDPWVLEHRKEWADKRRALLASAAQSAAEADRPGSCYEYAHQAVSEDAGSEIAWELLLRSASELGRGAEAAQKFARANKQRDKEGMPFSPALLNLAKSARDGLLSHEHASLEPSVGALAVLGRVLRRLMMDEPNEAARLLQTQSFSVEFGKNPAQLLPLLSEFRDTLLPFSEAWIHASHALSRGHYTLNHHQESLNYGTQILDKLSDDNQAYYLAIALSFCHFQMSKWDDAYAIVDRAISLAEKAGSDSMLHGARSQRASFLWHQGYFEEAIRINLDAKEFFQAQSDARSQVQTLIVDYNTGMMYIHLGEYPSALPYLESSYDSALRTGHTAVLGFVKPALAFLRLIQNRGESWKDLFFEGIQDAHRSTNIRGFEISMDFAAACLAHSGHHAEAVGLFRIIGNHRDRRKCPRTPAEVQFVTRWKEACGGASASPSWQKLSRRTEIIHALGDLLLGED